ncbi:hypothetical protein D3C76_1499120 [compost metagenome]
MFDAAGRSVHMVVDVLVRFAVTLRYRFADIGLTVRLIVARSRNACFAPDRGDTTFTSIQLTGARKQSRTPVPTRQEESTNISIICMIVLARADLSNLSQMGSSSISS